MAISRRMPSCLFVGRQSRSFYVIYVENGDFSGTLDVSTFSSSLRAFFAAFFAFLAVFRTNFVFLDIRCRPPRWRSEQRRFWASVSQVNIRDVTSNNMILTHRSIARSAGIFGSTTKR